MNSRPLLIAGLIAAVCIITPIIWPDTPAMLFALVFMGVVPILDITLPSWISLSIMVLLLVLAVRWVFIPPVYQPQASSKDLARRASARRKVLKSTTIKHAKSSHKTASAKA